MPRFPDDVAKYRFNKTYIDAYIDRCSPTIYHFVTGLGTFVDKVTLPYSYTDKFRISDPCADPGSENVKLRSFFLLCECLNISKDIY